MDDILIVNWIMVTDSLEDGSIRGVCGREKKVTCDAVMHDYETHMSANVNPAYEYDEFQLHSRRTIYRSHDCTKKRTE